VVGAASPPTVPRIGRSLGHPRQVIQRACNVLVDAGLIDTLPNPDHKRASLLVPTPRGLEVKARADTLGAAIASSLEAFIDPATAGEAARLLDSMRAGLEAHARTTDSNGG
jgi:DNA-binding MarR family transcriptional regulator